MPMAWLCCFLKNSNTSKFPCMPSITSCGKVFTSESGAQTAFPDHTDLSCLSTAENTFRCSLLTFPLTENTFEPTAINQKNHLIRNQPKDHRENGKQMPRKHPGLETDASRSDSRKEAQQPPTGLLRHANASQRERVLPFRLKFRSVS